MTPRTLLRLGAGAAVLGGALRMAAAFIPYTPESPALEALYALVDVCLLLGLTAIYKSESEHLGWPALIAFVVAFAGLASIAGPDATMFGVDWYLVGAAVAALGMAAFGVSLILSGRQVPAALCWLAAPTVAIAAPAGISFEGAGILFGLGFVGAGLAVSTPLSAGTD